eukprot:scaffold1517_cov60-Cyclotella_meneghiniana.AAC.1
MSTLRVAATALCVIALLELTPVASASCSSQEEPTFSCPNCGGITVSDCSQCDGYLFTDNARGIATPCGVGGGGLYVPLGILLLRFPPKSSSGLSQASIFGASLGGILVNIRKHHPNEHIRDTKGTPSEEHPGKIQSYEKDKGPAAIEKDRAAYLAEGDGTRKFYARPVIDYDMALFLAPMEMAGAVVGVIIQRLFPDWLYVSLAAIVLGYTSYKTFLKFKSSQKKEKEEKEKRSRLNQAESSRISAEQEAEQNTSEEKAIEDNNGTVEVTKMEPSSQANFIKMDLLETDDDSKELELRRHFLQNESRQYPKEKVAYLVLLWVGLTLITFLKGGKGVDSVIGITCQDPGYFVLLAAQFLWTFGFAAYFGTKNIKTTRAKQAVNYPFLETDVVWDPKGTLHYATVTFLAGIVAGLIGIGGGMVLGPLMLVMGVHPSVSTATTATMVLLTSSSVAVMFVMSGLLPIEYAVYFFSVCLIGAYIGKTKIDAYVKRTGLASVLIAGLASIIGLATVGCIVILFLKLDQAGWCVDGFRPFCVVENNENACPIRSLNEVEAMFPY